jgi:hypothetical protein
MQLKGLIFLFFYYLIPVAIGGYCRRHGMGYEGLCYIVLPYLAVVALIHRQIIKNAI